MNKLNLKIKNCIIIFFASALQAFTIYNVHAVGKITEGGIFGLTLLLQHWFKISPAISSIVLTATCFLLGWRTLGHSFICYSAVAAVGYSVSYAICENYPPLFPALANMPLLCAIIGAVLIGIGAGLCVRMGGATSGDDALAMSLSKLTKAPISRIYLISDLTVMVLSLSYISPIRIFYSLITVILSGQIIGLINKGER